MSENRWRFSREITLGDLTMMGVYVLSVAIFLTRLDGKVESVKTEQAKQGVQIEEVAHNQIGILEDMAVVKTKLDERTIPHGK